MCPKLTNTRSTPIGRWPGGDGIERELEVLEDAQASARSATLAMLASLKRAVGELDRIVAWLMVYGTSTLIRAMRRRLSWRTRPPSCWSISTVPTPEVTPEPRSGWQPSRSTCQSSSPPK